jgi:DNA polymerase III subunit delta'
LLDVPESKLPDYPYFLLLQKPENKQEIPIDDVRQIIKKLQLKAVVGADKSVKRTVLIDGANLMSAEAQNALLKMIEEPPPGTIFILTAISDSSVLPTIASRTEKLALTPVSLKEAQDFFKDQYSPDVIDSAWALSAGTAGLLNALLNEDSKHPLKIAVETAKKILSLKRYDRLLLLDSLSADKDEFLRVLDALSRITRALHRAAINSNNSVQAKKMAKARKIINSAIDSLQKNTSARLLILDLALRLPI